MFYNIVGSLWVALGLFWLIKPEALRNRLKRKIGRKIRWIVFGFVVVFGLSLAGSIIKAHGIFLKIVGIIGIIITIRGILLFTSKTSTNLLGRWLDKPIIYFRIWALVMLIAGLILIFM